jgi:hypothetical protein
LTLVKQHTNIISHKYTKEVVMTPLIFQEYDFKKAETQFPTINKNSDNIEVEAVAWIYALDILNNDALLLQEAIIGEHLESVKDMDVYHQRILRAVEQNDYEKIGKVVDEGIGVIKDKIVDYIEHHQEQMEYRYV